jgi:hypothetical protein
LPPPLLLLLLTPELLPELPLLEPLLLPLDPLLLPLLEPLLPPLLDPLLPPLLEPLLPPSLPLPVELVLPPQAGAPKAKAPTEAVTKRRILPAFIAHTSQLHFTLFPLESVAHCPFSRLGMCECVPARPQGGMVWKGLPPTQARPVGADGRHVGAHVEARAAVGAVGLRVRAVGPSVGASVGHAERLRCEALRSALAAGAHR